MTSKTETKSYKDHVEGSRKGRVHEAFDQKGQDVAWTLGQKLGLKQGTLRSWFGVWRREDEKAKGSKPAPKSKPTQPKKSAKTDNVASPDMSNPTAAAV